MKIIIKGRLGSLNQYIGECRKRAICGAKFKKTEQQIICLEILTSEPLRPPIRINYRYYEPNTRRDLDNISGWFHKVFQDALVERGLIPDDGWKYISGFSDEFFIDKENPRVEVEIEEVNERIHKAVSIGA